MIESLPSIRTCFEPLITTLITLASDGPSAPMPAAPAIDARPREPERGQALVEFAVVLLPLILVLVGILQFGFLFAAYVGVSNSAREAGRAGTIYEYDADEGQGQNDLLRCQAILLAARQSLDVGVPGQFSGTCAAVTGGGDLAIAYPDSGTCTGSSRTGCQLKVTLTFRQPIIVPLVGAFLKTTNDMISLRATVTMVIN
jgi:Flp pilus assembly protein TadG